MKTDFLLGTTGAIAAASLGLGLTGIAILGGPESKGVLALERRVDPITSVVPNSEPKVVDFRELYHNPQAFVGDYVSVIGNRTIQSCGSSTDGKTYSYDLRGVRDSNGDGTYFGNIAIVSTHPLRSDCFGVQGIWMEDKGVYFLVPREVIHNGVITSPVNY